MNFQIRTVKHNTQKPIDFGKDYYYIENKQFNNNSNKTINKWTIDCQLIMINEQLIIMNIKQIVNKWTIKYENKRGTIDTKDVNY